jgi:hypothetical protein
MSISLKIARRRAGRTKTKPVDYAEKMVVVIFAANFPLKFVQLQ